MNYTFKSIMFKYNYSSPPVAAGGDRLRHTEGRGCCILTSHLILYVLFYNSFFCLKLQNVYINPEASKKRSIIRSYTLPVVVQTGVYYLVYTLVDETKYKHYILSLALFPTIMEFVVPALSIKQLFRPYSIYLSSICCRSLHTL